MTARLERHPAPPPSSDSAEVLRLCRENLILLNRLAERYEVGRTPPSPDGHRLSSPEAVVEYLGPEMNDLAQEQLRVILLDNKNSVLGVSFVYQGGINAITVCLRDCFREAVRANAAAVIWVQNHPSGDPTPSPEDRRMTIEAARVGAILDIELIDHIVIARHGHFSLRRAGMFGVDADRYAAEQDAA